MLSVRVLSTSRECRSALLSSSLVSVKVSGRGDAVQMCATRCLRGNGDVQTHVVAPQAEHGGDDVHKIVQRSVCRLGSGETSCS